MAHRAKERKRHDTNDDERLANKKKKHEKKLWLTSETPWSYFDLIEAISMEKRYFTSDLSILS